MKNFILIVFMAFFWSVNATVNNPNPETDPLCINCGCERAYQNCLDGTCCSQCYIGTNIGSNWHVACCKDYRSNCHGNGIRIQLGFIAAGVQGTGNPTTGNTVDYYGLSQEDKDVLVAYEPIIADYENGIVLTDAQYAFLDEDHRVLPIE